LPSFPISFDEGYLPLADRLRLGPSVSRVTVKDDRVTVRMGWAFRATFKRSAVASVSLDETKPQSRGVHGWKGRWLVNGAGAPLVSIDIDPPARALIAGPPVLRLRRVTVSTDQPEELMAALR
jgi:hypothetical protein